MYYNHQTNINHVLGYISNTLHLNHGSKQQTQPDQKCPRIQLFSIFFNIPISHSTPELHDLLQLNRVKNIYHDLISEHDSMQMGSHISHVNRVRASSEYVFNRTRETRFQTFYTHLNMYMSSDHKTHAQHFKRNIQATNGLIPSSKHVTCTGQKRTKVNFYNPSCKNR